MIGSRWLAAGYRVKSRDCRRPEVVDGMAAQPRPDENRHVAPAMAPRVASDANGRFADDLSIPRPRKQRFERRPGNLQSAAVVALNGGLK